MCTLQILDLSIRQRAESKSCRFFRIQDIDLACTNMQALAEEWKSLSPEDKKEYEDLAAVDKKRVAELMAADPALASVGKAKNTTEKGEKKKEKIEKKKDKSADEEQKSKAKPVPKAKAEKKVVVATLSSQF